MRPDVILLIILLALTYLFVVRYSRRHTCEGPVIALCDQSLYRHAAFTLGLLLLYVALGPLALSAETQSFTAYVIQMLIMTMALPWLLVFSLPKLVFDSILSIPWCRRTIRMCVHPALALVTFNALVSVTLIPPVLDVMLTVNWVHMLAQSILFLSAIFFWWPLVSFFTQFPPLTRGRQLFYIVYSSNFMMPIIFLLFLADHPWYSIYHIETGPVLRLFPFSYASLADQQLGSIVMLVAMYIVYGSIAIRLYLHQDESIWYT